MKWKETRSFHFHDEIYKKMLAGNYIFKVSNVNTRARCEIYSKLTIKIFYILNNKHILHPVLLLQLLTLSRWMPAGMPSFRKIWTNVRYISHIFEWRCRFWKMFSKTRILKTPRSKTWLTINYCYSFNWKSSYKY